jgi:hypothetical protein
METCIQMTPSHLLQPPPERRKCTLLWDASASIPHLLTDRVISGHDPPRRPQSENAPIRSNIHSGFTRSHACCARTPGAERRKHRALPAALAQVSERQDSKRIARALWASCGAHTRPPPVSGHTVNGCAASQMCLWHNRAYIETQSVDVVRARACQPLWLNRKMTLLHPQLPPEPRGAVQHDGHRSGNL